MTNWQGSPFYYYMFGNGFKCATSVDDLLQSGNGDGQCGSFAQLLLYSLATNGISIQGRAPTLVSQAGLTSVGAVDGTYMIINKWQIPQSGTSTNPYTTAPPYPFPYNMLLNWPDYMYPALASYGDLTNEQGLPGQNSCVPGAIPPCTPSEKVFGSHYIVKVQSALTSTSPPGPYFDPSYGVWYANPTDFESQAVAGYMYYPSVYVGSPTPPPYFVARKKGAGGPAPNISLVP